MGFIQENLITLDLGLSKKYTMIQFTDVHVSIYHPSDHEDSINKAILQEKVWLKQRLDFAHKFNEKHDSKLLPSTECLSQLIAYTNHQHPDLVLLTGDIIDYYSPANYDFMKHSIENIHDPYLFMCGNHEYPSTKFKVLCQGHCDINHIEFDEFLVISIDNSTRKINSYQLKEFKKLLSIKKPIILAMHIPIMTSHNTDEFTKLDDYYSMKYQDCDEVTAEFIELVSSHRLVKAIFCGHIHGFLISYIAPNKPQYCCSSGLIGNVNKIIIT